MEILVNVRLRATHILLVMYAHHVTSKSCDVCIYGWRQGVSATCNFERLDSRVKFSYEKGVYFIIENTVLEFFKLGAQNG